MINSILFGDVMTHLATLPSNFYQCIIADPPYYNVRLDQDWDTQWKDIQAYLDWTEKWVTESMRTLKDDGLCFIFGQPGKREHAFLHVMSMLTRRFQFHDLIIWDRVVGYNNRGDSFNPQYEMVLVLRKSSTVKFIKDAVRVPYDAATIELYLRDKRYGDKAARMVHLNKGKYSTNIISVPSLKGISSEKCGHPSQKPEALVEKLIACSTEVFDSVLDPFLGSGTTALVAKNMNRFWTGIECDAAYVQMAEERLK